MPSDKESLKFISSYVKEINWKEEIGFVKNEVTTWIFHFFSRLKNTMEVQGSCYFHTCIERSIVNDYFYRKNLIPL